MSRKVNTTIVLAVLAIAISVGGCAVLDDMLIAPEGQAQSDTVKLVNGVAGVMVATGTPLAVPALAISTILTAIAGVYTNMRKKQKLSEADSSLTEADRKYQDVRTVVETIIEAIEATQDVKLSKSGTTLGELIKGKVKEDLISKDALTVGRAIIDAIKREGKI